MSNFLSQDDIDALLGAAMSGGGGTHSAVANTPENPGEIVTNIVNCYNEQIIAVAGVNLNREVSVAIDYVEGVSDIMIEEKIGNEYLLSDVPFSDGTEGNMRVIASKKSFAIISDLMTMGDGKAPYSDGCKDAISELFSQISGAFATELKARIGSPVSAAAPAISDNVGRNVLENDFVAFCKMTISDIDEQIDLLISPDDVLLEKMANDFGGASSSPAAAPSTLQPSIASPAAFEPTLQQTGSMPMPDNIFSSKVPKVNVDMLLDVELEIAIELGKANLAIKKVLDMAPGTLVELDRLAGEPVDLLVNNKVVAKGEVVVIDENFGVRIISLVSPEERIKSLR
jgi:flagellar motor switch protein FliN/FliY